MKIQRIETKSFTIDEDSEKRGEKIFKSSILAKISRMIGGEEIKEIKKSYKPLARFKVSRIEKVHKGITGAETVYEKRENYFYVDLSNADLYHISGKKICRFDILKKLVNLPRISAQTLGNLMKTGYIYREELDRQTVFDLMNLEMVRIYKSSILTLFAKIWDELNPEQSKPTETKERLQSLVKIPNFNDRGYNLSFFLEECDTIDETYEKDTIKYSVERIDELLSDLFDAEAVIDNITFMPYLRGFYKKKRQRKSKAREMYFPICFTSEIHLRKIKRRKGIKLKPIALATTIGASGSVPVEEPTINFSDVADLEQVKKEIMEAIIYPLMNPDLAREFGKKGGGAILLYGPPGCGKSYIAKATIGECGVPFFNVNISDLISRGVKAEAESLHKIFEEASRNSPAVIFFDEIDAIGGRRSEAKEYEERIKQAMSILGQVSEDTTTPRNIRRAAKESMDTLQSEEYTLAVRASNAISILDEILQDPNMPPYTRVKLWNVMSLLEAIKD